MSSRQNPLHVTSCYCYCYRFWAALSLSRALWKSAYSRSNMKPKANPKQARKCIEELFCWFQVLRQQFMFLLFWIICMHVPQWFFHSRGYSFHFAFISRHVPFILLSCSFRLYSFPSVSFHIFLVYSFQCAFMSLHLPFFFLWICMHVPLILHSYPLISFLSYGNGSKAWTGDRMQQMIVARLSLRLSPNNPSNVRHC